MCFPIHIGQVTLIKNTQMPSKWGKIGKIIYMCISPQILTIWSSLHACFLYQVSSKFELVYSQNLVVSPNLWHLGKLIEISFYLKPLESHCWVVNSPIRFDSNLEDLCRAISKIACSSIHLRRSIHTMDF